MPFPTHKLSQGCITDGEEYKIELHMPYNIDMSEFCIGTHVKIIGIVRCAVHPYLWVGNKSLVRKESDEIKDKFDLLKGTKIPKIHN